MRPLSPTPVRLIIPAVLLRRFRTLASELLSHESEDKDVHFHEALGYAAAEFMRAHADERPLRFTRSRLPVVSVHSAVHPELAAFVRRIALVSGLTLSDVWHLVVLEFCERSMAPGLEQPQVQQEAA